MATAKNRALDVLRRERTARTFAPSSAACSRASGRSRRSVEELFGADAIKDDLLRMMFSCCHPAPAGGGAGRARSAHPLRLQRGRGRQRASSAAARPSRSASRAPRRCSRGRSGCSTSRTPRISPRACRPSSARSICSSTRATTARRPNRPCAPSFAGEAMRLAALLLEHPLAADSRDLRARRAHVPPRRAPAGAARRVGRSELALRPGSVAMGLST